MVTYRVSDKEPKVNYKRNYGGDYNTLVQRGWNKQEAKKVYDDYMRGFPGVKAYQDYCRKAVIRDGYILMNPITGYRAHIEDWDELKEIRDEMEQPGFWGYYNDIKRRGGSEYQKFRHYFKRKGDLEKDSINYRMELHPV